MNKFFCGRFNVFTEMSQKVSLQNTNYEDRDISNDIIENTFQLFTEIFVISVTNYLKGNSIGEHIL